MSETDGNYSGQSTRPVEVSRSDAVRGMIDRTGLVPRPSWVTYAQDIERKLPIVPIDHSDRPDIAEMMAAQGLTKANLPDHHEINPRNIFGYGRPIESTR